MKRQSVRKAQEFFPRRFSRAGRCGIIVADRENIKESENDYLLELELPGFSKDDVSLVLENGYLTISATQNKEKEQKEYKYVRKERKSTSMQRSFYVGDNLTENDIKAGFDNGILTVTVPKKVEEAVETKKYIPIA